MSLSHSARALLRRASARVTRSITRRARIELARTRVRSEVLENRRLLASVTSANFDFTGASQGLDYAFDSNVGASATLNAISLVDLARGTTFSHSQLVATATGSNQVRVGWPALAATGTPAGVLPDGHYESILEDGGGSAFSAASVTPFSFYSGDSDGDTDVDGGDFVALIYGLYLQSHGEPVSYDVGDFDYSGVIDSADYDLLAARAGTKLAPLPDGDNTLTAGSDTASSVTLNFTAPTDPDTGVASTLFTAFGVFRSTDGVNFAQVSAANDPTLQRDGRAVYTYTDAGLTDGTKYFYRVRPFNSDATNGAAVGLWHTTNKVWSVTVLPPPGDLTATAASSTAVDLSWQDASQSATSFVIQRSADGGTTFADVGTSTTATFRDAGLVPGTAYLYRVAARNSVNQSAFTLPVGVTTNPAANAGLTATVSNVTDGITLHWDVPASVPAPQIDTYVVERKLQSGNGWYSIGDVSPSGERTFVDTGVVRGRDYSYRVVAKDAIAATLATLGPITVTYAKRAELSWTDDSVTILWPVGQAPPPSMIIDVTDPATGVTTSTTVPYTPPNPGDPDDGGSYTLPGLSPDHDYDLNWRNPNNPGGPDSTDSATRIRTRHFVDYELVHWYAGLLDPNVKVEFGPTVTREQRPDEYDPFSPEEYDEVGVLHDDGALTYKFSNLPKHTYVQMSGKIVITRDGYPGPETPKDFASLLASVTAAGTAVSGAATVHGTFMEDRAGAPGHRDEASIGWESDGWVLSDEAMAEATLMVSGMGPGWVATNEIVNLQVGTPLARVDYGQNVSIEEANASEKSFRVSRANQVDIEKPLTVSLALAQGPGLAQPDRVELKASITIPANEQFVRIVANQATIKAKDNITADGDQQIQVVATTGNISNPAIAIGTIRDNISVQKVELLKGDPNGDPKLGRALVAINGFSYANYIKITGERVDEVQMSQYITASTKVEGFDGTLLTRDQLFALAGVDPNSAEAAMYDTSGESRPDVILDGEQYVQRTNDTFTTKDPLKGSGVSLVDVHRHSEAMIATSRGGAPANVARVVDITAKFDLKFFAANTTDILKTATWSHAYSNRSYRNALAAPGSPDLVVADPRRPGAGAGMISVNGDLVVGAFTLVDDIQSTASLP